MFEPDRNPAEAEKCLQFFWSDDGDYVWVFWGNELVDEGHSVDEVRVLMKLGFEVEKHFVEIDPYSPLPSTLQDFEALV